MKRVSYESALRNEGYVCILQGNMNKLKNINRLKGVVGGHPISFHRLNKLLFKHLDCLEYIDFWSEIKIYKVEY